MNTQPPVTEMSDDEKREPEFGEEYAASRPGIKTLLCVVAVIGFVITSDYWIKMIHSL